MSINAGTAIGYLDLDINKFKSKFKDAQKQIDDFSSKSLGGMVKSLRNAETEFEQMVRGSVLDLGEGLKDVGKTMALTGGAILASIGGITMAGANWSAQVEGQKFLYNNLDSAIQKAIQSNSQNAEAIGLTSQQYKNGATDISTYYKNMGLTAEATADLSGKTMELVADLGAVKDVEFDEALADFKSALMGNYEAVDKYGISLSASTLENSEFVKSLGKSWNQLSDNEKMMAAYNEILRQGESAQGLAKQEAESFGMKFKLLKQQISETVGEIGTNLLPVLEPMIKSFSDTVKNISEWVKENPKLTQTLLIVAGAIGTFLTICGTLLGILGSLALVALTFNVAMLPIIGTVALVSAGIMALVAAGVWLYKNWDEIKAKASEAWSYICDTVSNFVSTATEWVKQKWEECKQWVVDSWNNVKNSAMEIWNSIGNFFSETIPQWIDNIVNWFNELPYNIGYALGTLLGNIVQWGVDTWNYLTTNVPLWIEGVSNWFKELPGKIWNWLTQAVQKVTQWGSNTYQKAIDGASKAINGAIQWFSQLPGKIWTWLSQAIQKMTQWATNMGQKAKEGAKKVVDNVTNGIKNLPSKVYSIGSDVVKSLWNGISSMASWIKNKISGFVSGIVDGFKGVKNKVSSAVNGGKSIEVPVTMQEFEPIDNNYSGVKFNYDRVKQTTISDKIAKNNSINESIRSIGNSIKSSTQDLSLANGLKEAVKGLSNTAKEIIVPVILDGKEIARVIAPHTDNVNGNRINLSERGLVL